MKMILFPRRILLPSMWKPKSSCNYSGPLKGTALGCAALWPISGEDPYLPPTTAHVTPLCPAEVKASMLNSIQITLHEPLLYINTCACVTSCFSRVWLFVTPWTVAHQPRSSMGFSRQEHWSRVPLPSPFLHENVSNPSFLVPLLSDGEASIFPFFFFFFKLNLSYWTSVSLDLLGPKYRVCCRVWHILDFSLSPLMGFLFSA